MIANKSITAISAAPKNLQLIQVLRGVASLLVLLLHATKNFATVSNKPFLNDFFEFGGSGVDIFFVLSGFIITYTSIKGLSQPNKLFAFIRRRMVRIFPIYWIIITLLLIAQFVLPDLYRSHYFFTPGTFFSTWFLLPGHSMVNGVSWTLSFELFFYLLFSLAFIIPVKKWAYCLFVLYALVLIAIPILGYNFENGNEWVKLISYPMNVEFFMGVTAALIIPKIIARAALPLITTGIILFLAAGIFYNNDHYLVGNTFNRVIIFGIPSFLIITGLVKFELLHKISTPRLLILMGEASYSLYLLHLPLIAATVKLISKLHIQNVVLLHIVLLMAIGLICFISILFYKWIEKPMINKLNAIGKRKSL